MQQKKEYFEWLNIARGIGMFLVVVGHACMVNGVVNKFLFHLIYSFHMQLFFFISGFCSLSVIKLDNMHQKLDYCRHRAVRLIVPYICVGIIYIFLDKLFGITDLYGNGWLGVLMHMFQGDNPNWQLWTLYALFVCSVICVFFKTKKLKLLVIVAVILQIVYYTPLVNFGYCTILVSIEEFLIYFVGGLLVRKYYSKLNFEKKGSWKWILFLLLGLLGYNLFSFRGLTYRVFDIIAALMGIGLIINISILMQNKSTYLKKGGNLIGKHGMDIYILANLWQEAVRLVLWEKMMMSEWIVLIFSVGAGIVIPIILSKYFFRKTVILKKLILGEK